MPFNYNYTLTIAPTEITIDLPDVTSVVQNLNRLITSSTFNRELVHSNFHGDHNAEGTEDVAWTDECAAAPFLLPWDPKNCLRSVRPASTWYTVVVRGLERLHLVEGGGGGGILNICPPK